MVETTVTENVSIENIRLRLETLRFFAKEHLKKAESILLGAQHLVNELNEITADVAKLDSAEDTQEKK